MFFQNDTIVPQLKEEKMKKNKVFLVLLLQLMALHAWASTGQTLDLFKELMSFEINIDDSFAKFVRQHKISKADAHEIIYAADLLSGEESIIRDIAKETAMYNESFEFNTLFGVYIFFDTSNQHATHYVLLFNNNEKKIFDESCLHVLLSELLTINKENKNKLSDSMLIKILETFRSYESFYSLQYNTQEIGGFEVYNYD